jgi:predicted transcriptional regulator
MATNLLDLTADIVIAHASVTEMSSDDLLMEINMVYATLDAIAKGGKAVIIETSDKEPKKQAKKTKAPAEPVEEKAEEKPAAPPAPAMTIEEAFKPDKVACMICGKMGMVTLKRHLASAHDLKPGQYRKQFNIPREQPLAAVEYVEKRRQAALDRGLGAKLVAAREAKKARQLGE